MIQHSRWLAHLGDGLYQLALWLNHHFNRLRHRMGLHYWSLSQYLKHKVKNAVSFITDFEEALAGEAPGAAWTAWSADTSTRPNCATWAASCTATMATGWKACRRWRKPDGQLQLLDWAAIQAEHQAGRQADPSSRKPRSLSLPALPSALRRQGKHP